MTLGKPKLRENFKYIDTLALELILILSQIGDNKQNEMKTMEKGKTYNMQSSSSSNNQK